MKFLGLQLDNHDANLTFCDGRKARFHKTERERQIKHHAFDNLLDWVFVLNRWDVSLSDLDAVAIVIDSRAHPQLRPLSSGALAERYEIPLPGFDSLKCPLYRIDHHYAHALSCWPLGVEEPSVEFVFDGIGDDERSHSVFRAGRMEQCATLAEAESIGRALSWIGTKADMKGNKLDFAGKLMGLKSYGDVDLDFLATVRDSTIYDVKELFRYPRWVEHVGQKNEAWARWHDWLGTLHHQCEVMFPKFFLEHADPTDTVTYSGGVAQNSVINAKIKEVIPDLHIPPHCPDDGLSLGCVEFLRRECQQEPFDRSGFPFWEDDVAPDQTPSDDTIDRVAELLAQGRIVAWYQGHGELGPRALGNRSILMDPRIPDGKDIINRRVKHREPYRPFGASVLEEKAGEYFDFDGPSRYMLFVMDVRDREALPAVTHVDGTCRAQTVPPEQEHFHRLIERFEQRAGLPMLLNTSLNNNGAPIAGKPTDALKLFDHSDLDALVVGDEIKCK